MTAQSSLLAVHISDGVLFDWATAIATALSVAFVLLALRRIDDAEIPRLGLFTAAIFVASQIHFRVGVTTTHLLLNAIAGIVLGWRAPAAIAVAVLLQALLFAHGGLTTWGINTITMSLPALLAGWLFHRAYCRWPARAFAIGWFLGLAAATMTVSLAGAVVYFLAFESQLVVGVFVLSQLPVIGLEGIISAAIVYYLSRVQPEWLRQPAVR